MKNLIFGLGFLGLATCIELCGESCEDLDQQFKDINEVIAQLKSENEAIEAENAAIEREINRLYVRILDYIDVGDRCWRRNVLVTILRCW